MVMSLETQVDEAARELAIEARSLLGLPDGENAAGVQACRTAQWIKRLAEPPTSLQFAQIVGRHVPVLIQGCIQQRPCYKLWQSSQYLIETMGDRQVQVALTPNGRADDLHDYDGKDVFVLPFERRMSFSALFKSLHESSLHGNSPCVAYLQSQNSNLTVADDDGSGDLSPLLRDLLPHVATTTSPCGSYAWADEALDRTPEACNLWIGTEHSRTSMHRDHYENLFSVVRGTKTFTLYPPCEAHFLCEDEPYDVYQWNLDDEQGWSLQPSDSPPTPWIPIDPTQPASSPRNARHPRYAQALPPLVVEVKQGETLYLPAGWYHHVAQRGDEQGICVCVNWWYESESAFGDRWALESFVKQIGRLSRGQEHT